MLKITTPVAILIGSILIASAILLKISFFDVFIAKAQAEVDGMDSLELQNDYDFENAVKDIVNNNCSVNIIKDFWDESQFKFAIECNQFDFLTNSKNNNLY